MRLGRCMNLDVVFTPLLSCRCRLGNADVISKRVFRLKKRGMDWVSKNFGNIFERGTIIRENKNITSLKGEKK